MNGTGSVVITGASGLLGRALMTKFQESGLFEKVIGTALNRYLNRCKCFMKFSLDVLTL